MFAHAFRTTLRVCLPALVAVLALLPALANPTMAARVARTDGDAQVNVPLQACGRFNVVTTFTFKRLIETVTRPGGHAEWERTRVQFAGTAANSVNGASLAYEGWFTRTADLEAGTVAISDLVLRITPPAGAAVETRIARTATDVSDWPPSALMAVGPRAVTAHLCDILAGSGSSRAVRPGTGPQP